MVIPDRIKSACTMFGEVPIPFTTLVVKGVPDFTVTDMENWEAALSEKLCGICGQRLDYWIYFIGGPGTYRQRFFFDVGMHEECARYSLDVCPYLAGKKDYRKQPRSHENVRVEIKHDAVVTEDIYLMKTRSYRYDLARKLIMTAPLTIVEQRKRA